ncbi:hypothetical protein V6N13_040253 [Hibiscus sabdariffa]
MACLLATWWLLSSSVVWLFECGSWVLLIMAPLCDDVVRFCFGLALAGRWIGCHGKIGLVPCLGSPTGTCCLRCGVLAL